VTETDNEDPKQVWGALYGAITNANQTLTAIADMGNTPELQAAKGEALLCRAYSHFILVNLFSNAYNPATAAKDLAVPYMDGPETELNPKYERGNVADFYAKLEKDIEEGLPLIDDGMYSVPKYHFNEKAAYTFASRFYLFYGKWDKAIECANHVLGSAPAEYLRNYAELNALPTSPPDVRGNAYNSTNSKNNFLVQTAYSSLGLIFGPYYFESRISAGNLLMQTEMFNNAPWGGLAPSTSSYNYRKMYKLDHYVYVATGFDKTILPRLNYLFEYTDPVAGIGYYRTLYAALTAEEALLNRAEAYIMKGQYELALADMNLWTANTLNPSYCDPVLTDEVIKNWASGMEYYTDTAPTPKKKLNPLLTTITEGSDMEAYVHAILYMRRAEFYMMGLRWLDVKRYGIEITRRKLGTTLEVLETYDRLTVDDERRALQLPKDVITAGMTPNPR
jgi:tetratricopeptide (TPR) repeat protein